MSETAFCILAAGWGSSLREMGSLHKALFPLQDRAVISHIIEKVPPDLDIVVAVGYQGDILKEYLQTAHPDRSFTFVDVDRIEGEGSGPGYSLIQCAHLLQRPFYLSTCDTLIEEDLPPLNTNWIGLSPCPDGERYATADVTELGTVIDFRNKGGNLPYAWIGLAGILDYHDFWWKLQTQQSPSDREIEIVRAFYNPLDWKRLRGIRLTWHDTGNPEAYRKTRARMGGASYFDKWYDTATYHIGGKCLKVSVDPRQIQRLGRRQSHLQPLVPEIRQGEHLLSYNWVEGKPLYHVRDVDRITPFFDWCRKRLWEPVVRPSGFSASCRRFYEEKTWERLKILEQRRGLLIDRKFSVNGIDCAPLRELLKTVDWQRLSLGTPVRIHGDLQFDNVLLTDSGYVLIDWRDAFDGRLDCGDVYYDLGKLYGGMLLDYRMLKEREVFLTVSRTEAQFRRPTTEVLDQCRAYFEHWVGERYEMERIRLIAALIHLNMAPLHQPPNDLLLYFSGVQLLQQLLGETK